MATATEVAAFLVNKGIETGRHVRPMELQRLIYLAQCESYRRRGIGIVDDAILAEAGGVVCTPVWRKYYLWGALRIQDRQAGGNRLDATDREIAFQTLVRFGGIAPGRQIALVKAPGGPWHRTVHGCATLPAPIDFGGFDGARQTTADAPTVAPSSASQR